MRRLALVIALGYAAQAAAVEGMWPPEQLPAIAPALKQAGLELDPGELDELTKAPMDAIVGLGFCTGSFVSPQGLVATNHHCAYGAIQFNSTAERNLLTQGYVAASPKDDLPGDPALRVYVTESIRDVTAELREKIDAAGTDSHAAYLAYDAASKALVKECEATGHHRCEVYVFHGGRDFRLIRQLEIRDVRLAYAPPESVGKFGGDVDNWMWPRHTGDFTLLRAYVGPDGKPAARADANVPYRPKSHLRIATRPLEPGDYAMVVGYPGRTYRWRLAEELADTIEWAYPTAIAQYDGQIRVVEQAAKASPEAKVKYAAALASWNNVLKNYRGQLEGFARGRALERKLAEQQAFETWLRGRSGGSKPLDALRTALDAQRALRERHFHLTMIAPRGATGNPLASAYELYRLAVEREKPDAEREYGFQQRDEVRIKARLDTFDRRFDPAVDRALFEYRLSRYAALPAKQRVAELDAWLGLAADATELPESLDEKLDAYYAALTVDEAAARTAMFAADRATLEASKDPAMQLAVALHPALLAQERALEVAQGDDLRLRSAVMDARIAQAQREGRAVYPDANGSLRVSFGTVQGYSPRDAVQYAPFTTLEGIVEKSTGVAPFDTPQKLLDAIREQRFGDYRDAKQPTVPVNYLTDLDITGGNSGSPTLDARGELVGLVFDGNIESVSSNWVYDPAITRAIHVDTRYMLWVMDEIDEAKALVRELRGGRGGG